ncbi:hypothetical protein [Streptacidiphilus sp. EB129]|uniref:hypothetical protein n=1 Tax=Streptacidiphilus sp. EB129 TaxID=3156262 RepID=UPI0035153C99
MTTAVRPTPAHGTEARYKGNKTRPGCRCPVCTRMVGQRTEARRLRRLEGNPHKIPAGPVIAHLAELRAADMSWGQIANAAGTSPSTPREIYVEQFATVLRSTADRILAVRPHSRPATGFISSIGAMRRLRALYALGHAHTELVRRSPVSSSSIEEIISGQNKSITVGADRAIRRLYDDLSMTVGRSTKTRLRARREGWAPPLAWDDIDDPQAVPDLGERAPRPAAVAEDVAFLEALGIDRDRIAERLDFRSWNGVEKALSRAGGP